MGHPLANSNRRLFIINYTMDSNHPFLGHSPEWARTVAREFDQVAVMSADAGATDLPEFSEIHDLNWVPGRPVRNVLRELITVTRVLASFRPSVAFVHMATVQGLIAAPILKLLGVHLVAWYAHESKPQALTLLRKFANEIVTASEGSCPRLTPPAVPIGHGVAIHNVQMKSSSNRSYHLVHAGRSDSSKRIQLIVETVAQVRRQQSNDLRLTLIGSPSNDYSAKALQVLHEAWLHQGFGDWLQILPSMPRNALHEQLRNYGAFIHAFPGSLDKAPLEASLCGLPVISANHEVQQALGGWSRESDLLSQLIGFLDMSDELVMKTAAAQQASVIENHSLTTLGARLRPYLLPETDSRER